MTRRHRFVIVAVLALFASGPAARHAAGEPQTLSIPYVHPVPTLDDFAHAQAVADAHTAGMAMVDALTQRTPNDGAPVSERTRVYIGYDTDNVYAAFICFDSTPSAVRGQLVGRERIPDDDDNVALQLDTFGDRKHAYTFQVSAAGVQRDGIWTESAGTWDFSFDTIWDAESRRTQHGYVVLITVPLSSLRFLARAEQFWGLFFFREIPLKGEAAFRPAHSSRVAGRLTQAASATGVRGVASARKLQLTPYSTVQALQDKTTGGAGSSRAQSHGQARTLCCRGPLWPTIRPGGAADTNRALFATGRAARNLGQDAFIGAFMSTRTHDASENRLLGVDGRFALGSNWTGAWQAVTASSMLDGRRVAAGPAYSATISRSGRSMAYAAEWNDRSAGFAERSSLV